MFELPDWLLGFFGDVTLAQVVVGIAAICALVWLIRKIWPGLRAAMKLTDMLGQLPTFMDQTKSTLTDQDSMLERLRRQVENDHSTNLRDEITQAVDTAQAVSTSLEGVHGRLDDLQQKVAGIEEKLTKDNDRIKHLENSMSHEEIERIRRNNQETENQ